MPKALSEKILPSRRSRASKAKTTRDIVGACADLLGTSAAAADVADCSVCDVAATSTSDVAANTLKEISEELLRAETRGLVE